MKRLIKKALALFKKPKEEITPTETAWPFPVSAEKKKVIVPKATTRAKKPAAKKVAAKKTAKKKVK